MAAGHLLLKKNIYHFRIRVPRDLSGLVGRDELRKSLGTSHRPTAERRSLVATALAYRLFDTLQSMPAPSPNDVQVAMRAFYDGLLAADLVARVRTAADPAQAPAWESYVREQRRSAEVDQLRQDLAIGRIAQVEAQARQLIAERGWTISPDSGEFYEICFALLRTLVEATARRAERDRAVYWGNPSDPLVGDGSAGAHAAGPQPPGRPERPVAQPGGPAAGTAHHIHGSAVMAPTPPDAPASPPAAPPAGALPPKPSADPHAPEHLARNTPADLLDMFFAEKKRQRDTRRDYEVSLRVLDEVSGGKAIGDLTKGDILAFKTELLKTPKNYVQRFNTTSIRAARAANAQLPTDQRHKTLNPITVRDKYLSNVKTLLAWAAENGIVSDNVARTITVKCGEPVDQRVRFEPEELRKLWGSPPFAGCAGTRSLLKPGAYQVRDHRFWAPLISRFMGLRIGEIGRLQPGDFVVRHELPCIYVRRADPARDVGPWADTVKTSHSVRHVPIPQVLQDLGLLAFVDEARRQRHKRLFPKWLPGAKGYSATLGKWFNGQLLPTLGIKADNNSFHSLRHNFEQTLSDAGLSDHIQLRLMGHSPEEQGVRSKYLSKDLTREQLDQFLAIECGAEVAHLINLRTGPNAKTGPVQPRPMRSILSVEFGCEP